MLLITCPVCGAEGDETDFHAGGEAHISAAGHRSILPTSAMSSSATICSSATIPRACISSAGAATAAAASGSMRRATR